MRRESTNSDIKYRLLAAWVAIVNLRKPKSTAFLRRPQLSTRFGHPQALPASRQFYNLNINNWLCVHLGLVKLCTYCCGKVWIIPVPT